jgi:hypothetical protein
VNSEKENIVNEEDSPPADTPPTMQETSATENEVQKIEVVVAEKKPTSATKSSEPLQDSSIDSDSTSKKTSQQPTLVITGLVKNNAAKHLRKLGTVIRRVAEDFQLEGLIFYENDSTDKTVKILN